MSWRALLRFISVAALFAIVSHLLVALAAVGVLHRLYPHRIFDVRSFSDNPVEGFRLIGTYLNENARHQVAPVVVVAGSSVSYGYLWPERVTFARLFADARPSAKVLNVSIVAADVSAVNDWIVCAARRNQIRVDSLIVELPVVNTLSYLVTTHRSGHAPSPLSTCEEFPRDPGYFRFAVTKIRGSGWIRLFWSGQTYKRGERQIRIESVPKGYFASAEDFESVRGGFAAQISATLTRAQSVADRVYAFPSPVFVPGLAEVGEDAAAIRQQLDAALAACRSVPGVGCIDSSGLYDGRSFYSNLTHLNQAGHRAMAALLDRQIPQ